MTRLICSILAAGSAAVSLSSPARADEFRDREEHRPAPIASRYDDEGLYGPRYEGMRFRDHERRERWRELEWERQRFYSFRHTRWECARFERWYARRCQELRFQRW
jgi:Ni/Co efflux regulator RcnB